MRSVPWECYRSLVAGDPFLWVSFHQIFWEGIMPETNHQSFPGSIRQHPNSLLEMARFSSSSRNGLSFLPPIFHHLLWRFTPVFFKSGDLSQYCLWQPFSALWIFFLYNIKVKCHLCLKIVLSPILHCALTRLHGRQVCSCLPRGFSVIFVETVGPNKSIFQGKASIKYLKYKSVALLPVR